MKNVTRLERLNQLLKVMELQQKAASKKKAAKLNGDSAFFDMQVWFVQVDKEYVKEGFCTTAACALGSAALHPWFKKRGLHVELYGGDMGDMGDIYDAPHGVPIDRKKLEKGVWGEKTYFPVQYGSVKYKGEEGITAAMDFFGIEHWEAAWLFNPAFYPPGDIYVPPARVIKRIKDVITHYKDGKDSNAYITGRLDGDSDS